MSRLWRLSTAPNFAQQTTISEGSTGFAGAIRSVAKRTEAVSQFEKPADQTGAWAVRPSHFGTRNVWTMMDAAGFELPLRFVLSRRTLRSCAPEGHTRADAPHATPVADHGTCTHAGLERSAAPRDDIHSSSLECTAHPGGTRFCVLGVSPCSTPRVCTRTFTWMSCYAR